MGTTTTTTTTTSTTSKHPRNSGCLVAIGRYNPPHKGHVELLQYGIEYAKENNLDFLICPTNTQDSAKNPLNLEQKIYYLTRIAPKYAKNILFVKYPELLDELTSKPRPYNSLQIEKALKQTIGYATVKVYHSDKDFTPIETVSGPPRLKYRNTNPDDFLISASKIRKTVINNDFNGFLEFYTLKMKSATVSRYKTHVPQQKFRSLDGFALNNVQESPFVKSSNRKFVGNITLEDLRTLFDIIKREIIQKTRVTTMHATPKSVASFDPLLDF